MEKTLLEMIEDQINKELWSAYIYFDIAEYYRGKGLGGFHNWFESQAREELEHAEKFAEYLQDQNEKFKLKAIPTPTQNFTDLRSPLLTLCEHESLVTSLINSIYKHAESIDDITTKSFLHWFVMEQIEEEKTAKDLLKKYDMFAKDGGLGLYQIDKDLSESRGAKR